MSEANQKYSDFDTQLTPEEMEQDWIEWNEDLRDELEEFYQDDEPADIDHDDRNPYDGTSEYGCPEYYFDESE